MSNWFKKLEDDFTKLASDLPSPTSSVISLASPSFNWAVGNGGLTEGKAVCFFGPESSGKSLLAQLTIIALQKKDPNGVVVWFDAEYSFNKDWFIKLGGDPDRILVRQTNDPLDIFDYCWTTLDEMCKQGMPLKAIVLDSVKSVCYPGDEKDKSTSITMGGAGAKYLGPTLKRLLRFVKEHNVTTLFVQQVYEELDQYKAMANPYVIPSGRALKHYCDYMIQVEKFESKKNQLLGAKTMSGVEAQLGHKVRVKIKKNRVGAPARVGEFFLDYENGIVNTEEELFELAKSLNVIFHPISESTGKPSNMLWQFENDDPIRGQDNMKQLVLENTTLRSRILKACLGVSEDAIELRNQTITEDDNIVEGL